MTVCSFLPFFLFATPLLSALPPQCLVLNVNLLHFFDNLVSSQWFDCHVRVTVVVHSREVESAVVYFIIIIIHASKYFAALS